MKIRTNDWLQEMHGSSGNRVFKPEAGGIV